MRKIKLTCVILTLILLFAGCGSKTASKNSASTAPQAASGLNAADQSANSNLSISNGSTADSAKGNTVTNTKLEKKTDQETKIIRFCTLLIQEDDLGKLSDSIQKKTKELGGYIESDNTMEQRITTVVRIPSDKFDEFVKFTEDGYKVVNKNITTNNITDAYVDNDARLKNLRAQEDQILTILKKANTVDEVLKVQAELYRIRGEADSLEAMKKSWDKQVDYSTITINADKKAIVPDSKKTIIGGSEFFKAIGKGFSNTSIAIILFLENLLIFIFSNIIVLGILGVAGFFGFRWYKKNNKIDSK
ncbi:DUF4349 domain-containing protein [Candidatus Clostridium radicumherbarum]|uniref:DUF4349 domain-containing protein n=1 Tax=Candidatus Clostridium radicumherbarum TaxID=3381662 RepID=A0ABW8TVM9_9CLOT